MPKGSNIQTLNPKSIRVITSTQTLLFFFIVNHHPSGTQGFQLQVSYKVDHLTIV